MRTTEGPFSPNCHRQPNTNSNADWLWLNSFILGVRPSDIRLAHWTFVSLTQFNLRCSICLFAVEHAGFYLVSSSVPEPGRGVVFTRTTSLIKEEKTHKLPRTAALNRIHFIWTVLVHHMFFSQHGSNVSHMELFLFSSSRSVKEGITAT